MQSAKTSQFGTEENNAILKLGGDWCCRFLDWLLSGCSRISPRCPFTVGVIGTTEKSLPFAGFFNNDITAIIRAFDPLEFLDIVGGIFTFGKP
jgi:hypothetical protein